MNQISRLTALLLALVMLLGSVSLAEGGLPIGGASGLTSDDWASLVDQAEESLFYTDEGATGQEVIPEAPELPEKPAYYPYTDLAELTLIQGETSAEASITASGAAVLSCAEAGQWQISVDGVWANLSGETAATLTVTGAMVNGQSAEIRKALGLKNAETGEYEAYTQTAVISIIEAAPAMLSVSRDAATGGASDANSIMTLEAANQANMVVIQVIYRNKDTQLPVADPYIGQIAKGSALSTTLTLPRVAGYLATSCTIEPAIYADKGVAAFTKQTADAAGTLAISVTEEHSTEDIKICVEYEPTNVNFVVKHFQQNVDNDGYTEVTADEVTVTTGKTGDPVGSDLAKTYDGFSAIWYDPTTAIAADGSTVVEIYYNREYYLMTFDLGGGHGVDPIYARYGAETKVGAPQRAGYTFAGWVDKSGASATVPATMPVGGAAFVATWAPATTTFIVAYWLENPNDEGYSFWGSYQLEGRTGTTVQGATYQVYPEEVANELDAHEKYYSYYDHADENVVISGDGSTVVNVYYDREEYTLKFYYAFETDNKFYIVGGSTWAFSDVSTDTALENAANGLYGKGQVDSKPELNVIGKSRGYTSDFDYSRNNSYKYHYISFAAKYGADISEKWPCNVFESATRINRTIESNGGYKNGWTGMEAFVSAWNGGYRVYYSMHNINETIKGNYNQLDYQLLLDSGEVCGNSDHETEDSDTVSYLCFWENGSDNVDWNVPRLFRYQIWVPVLEGQDISALPDEEKTERNGVSYYRRNVYDTCDNSNETEQTAPAITGYKYTNDYNKVDLAKTEYDGSVYDSAMIVNFYYSRNTYNLSFTSYGDQKSSETLYFEQDISGKYFEPAYPAGQEEGALEFVGWYTTDDFIPGTEFVFTDATMPANDVALFAKWQLVKHNVDFWIDQQSISTTGTPLASYPLSTHGMTIPDAYGDVYKAPDTYLTGDNKYKDYTFAGWYYIDENDNEMRFDIETMPITREMDIYAKWTSDKPVEFVFKFYHENNTQLAEDYTGQALPGTPVTLNAKIGDELTLAPKQDNLLGYIPYVNSHTITLDVDATKNVFTFLYQEPATVKYTVQYLAAKYEEIDGKNVLVPIEGVEPLVPEKTDETTNAIVTENYVPVLGYMPQATQLRLIVCTDEKLNVLQFLYVKNDTNELYDATHIIIDHNNQETVYFTESGKQGTIGQPVTVNKQTISGYTFKEAKVEQTRYDDAAKKWVTEEVVAEKTDGTSVQHTLTNGGMHVYLYYTPVQCPVTVRHLKFGTAEKLLEDESITAAYGSTLTAADYAEVEKVNEKQGTAYRVSSYDPLTHVVKVDDGTAPAENVITIYYEPDVADIKISKQITESLEEDAPDLTADEWKTAFTFTVTLKDKDGKAMTGEVNVTLTKADVTTSETMTLTNGVLTFKLQHGWTMTIHDLPVGTQYTITETETATFKTSYSTETTGTLTMLDVDMIVTNLYPKYAGELTIKKDGLEDTKESAIVKADVGGETYYLVLNKTNGYTATISGIKPGTTYTVSEVTAWTWQYGSEVAPASGTITETDSQAFVTITNTYGTDKWLHDESHVENDFNTQQSTGVNQ